MRRSPMRPSLAFRVRVGVAALTLLPCAATIAHAASERVAPPGTSLRSTEAATRLGKCPPGQIAYTDGTSLAVRCVCPPGTIAVRHGADPDKMQCEPASPCAAGQSRDARSGECRCPPGQLAYRSGGGGAPKCVAARSCPPGIKRDAATGQCQCPPGTRVYWDGAGGGGCVQ